MLRLRSDEQLVALFRAGNDEAFRVIHDRYRKRLFAYTRQMLPGSRQDAEDALQDVFVKAYAGLRIDDRELALRAWLYRVAHNRCIDQLRRARPILAAVPEVGGAAEFDPIAAAEQRETLRRLIADVQRLPAQQRSALLMRELSGMSYAELSTALGVSVSAVKSLLVRARLGLAAALEARETSCLAIREELVQCHDRGVRPTGTARRHMRDCPGCRDFRRSVRGFSRSFAALTPALGPLGFAVKVIGGGGAGAAGTSGAVSTGGAVATGGAAAASGGAIAGGFAASTAGHVATLLAAAIVTAGGAVAVQPILTPSPAPIAPRTVSAPVRGTVLTQPARAGASAPQVPAAVAKPSSGPARLVGLGGPAKRTAAVAGKKRSRGAVTGATGGLIGDSGADGTTSSTGTGGPAVPGTDGVSGTGLPAGSSGSLPASSGTDLTTSSSGTTTADTGSTGSTDPSSSSGTTGTATGSSTDGQTGTQANSGGASSSPGSAWGYTGGSGTYSDSTGTS